MGSKLKGGALDRLTDRWAQAHTYKQLDCTSLISFGKKDQEFYWSQPIDRITYSKLPPIAFLRCCFNDNSMAKHLLDFEDVTLMPPWAKCPCWAWEAMIPSLVNVVQLQVSGKQRSGRGGELFRSMPFILKGKAVGLRSWTISLKHDFVCAAGVFIVLRFPGIWVV